MIDDARAKNPKVKFLLAKPYYYDQSKTDFVLNDTAASKSSVSSPIIVFNPYNSDYNINAGNDTVDGIHNNSRGAIKMANAFATAITPIINSLLTGSNNISTNCSSTPTSSVTTQSTINTVTTSASDDCLL